MSVVGRLSRGLVCGMLAVLSGCAGGAASAGHDWADAPACPPAPERTELTSPKMGCANASNLAAMLDDPSDLRKGRRLTPADGVREAHAVDNYQKGPIAKSAAPAPVGAGAVLLTGGQ
jgi:hypothetical protein